MTTVSRITTCPACGTKNRVPVAARGTPRCASCHTDQLVRWVRDVVGVAA